MKTKLVYMLYGAIIATFGYLVGSFDNINAEDEVARVKKLIVSEEIILENDNNSMRIMPGTIIITDFNMLGENAVITTVSAGHISIGSLKDTKLYYKAMEASVAPTLMKDGTQVKSMYYQPGFFAPENSGFLILDSKFSTPFIDILKPKNKKITLSISNQSSIKLSNGGLNSKIIRVE
ncbi:MAG: hypothetical protein OXI24_04770 [Candidatus Poribacteria bacterium]|nr:hypothetical protein [Candidatus Poribacteria bacterium]